MRNRVLVQEDLAWAGLILVIAALFGVLQHWSLVRLAWQGGLAVNLEQWRAQQRERQFQGVKTVNLEQAHEIWRQGQAIFIDARKPEEYAELHIARAVNLPAELSEKDLAQVVAQIPQDRQAVVYCGQASCNAALQVAERLQALGYTQVVAYLGGFKAWDEAGYPVDTSK